MRYPKIWITVKWAYCNWPKPIGMALRFFDYLIHKSVFSEAEVEVRPWVMRGEVGDKSMDKLYRMKKRGAGVIKVNYTKQYGELF